MSETGTTQEQSEAQPVPPFRPNLDIITTMERSDPRRGLKLTRRESAVAELVAHGLTNRQIARALSLSPKTVEVHLARAFAKLDVTSRIELSRVLHPEGLAEPDETGHKG